MNVKSLQSNSGDKERSVEMRIAKVAFTIFFLFVCSWTPYAVVTMTVAFGNRFVYLNSLISITNLFLLLMIYFNRDALTPFSTMLPALFAKTVSCIDPWVYAINHPR